MLLGQAYRAERQIKKLDVNIPKILEDGCFIISNLPGQEFYQGYNINPVPPLSCWTIALGVFLRVIEIPRKSFCSAQSILALLCFRLP